jgi:hypothetical protein
MSAYARSSMLPIKNFLRTENGSDGKEPRGRNKRTFSSKAGRGLGGNRTPSRPSNHLLAPSNVLNRPAISIARNNYTPAARRRPTTAPLRIASNEENHQPFPDPSTLTVTGTERNFQDLSQLSMWSQDQSSTASVTQPTSNHDSAILTYASHHPPLRQQSVSTATHGSRGGSTFYSQGSLQKSASSRISFASCPTAASTNRSRSSRVSVNGSTTPNVAAPNQGFASRSRQASRKNLLPATPYVRSILRPAQSYTSTLTHLSKPGSRSSGAPSSNNSGPALHQASWGSVHQSSNTSLAATSLSTSSSESQQANRGPITDLDDHVKTLVQAELDSRLSDRLEQLGTKEALLDDKMKQMHHSLDERLTTANELHTERVQELDSKKQELDKKVSKVANMIKAAEGTVAKVSHLAENAVVIIDKARSDLVESALPFLMHPVAKMVESLFGDLRAKASADALLSKDFSFAKSPPPKLSPAPQLVTTTKATNSSKMTPKNRKLAANNGEKDSKRGIPKKNQVVSSSLDSKRAVHKKNQVVSSSSTKQTSSSSSSESENLFSPSTKTSFKPLTLVGIRATTTDGRGPDDDVFTAPKKKQSCVTPCEKAFSQAMSDSDLSQDSSCCTDSPLATKKRNAPLQPKRGRSKKARNTYGGGGSRRRSGGDLNDNFSFL